MNKLIIYILLVLSILGCSPPDSSINESIRKVYPSKKAWKTDDGNCIVKISDGTYIYVKVGLFGITYKPLVEIP